MTTLDPKLPFDRRLQSQLPKGPRLTNWQASKGCFLPALTLTAGIIGLVIGIVLGLAALARIFTYGEF